MLNLISLGLNLKSITAEALETTQASEKIYLETYTVRFPYTLKQLEKQVKKKIIPAPRELVESQQLINQAKKYPVALLIYGNALSATTHITLITDCIKNKIPYKIIHNSGILEAIAETGLQLYKFGKTASLPAWKENYNPKSFMNIINDNQKIKAHTLLLVDPELNLSDSLKQLQETGIKQKIIIAENLGNNPKIYYDTISKLEKKKISQPFAVVIPAEMHFVEEEALNLLKQKT